MSEPVVKLLSDVTERTRTVRIYLDPPEPWTPPWSEARTRAIERVTVVFTDKQTSSASRDDVSVVAHGRYLLKNGSLGAQSWSYHLWSSSDDPRREQFIKLARAAL